MKQTPWGFSAGMVVGSLLTLAALTMTSTGSADGEAIAVTGVGASTSAQLWHWLVANLGHSFWFFALVLVLYLMNLLQLDRLLGSPQDPQQPDPKQVVELDQLSDVWIHLFVGIGVIWTAVGMRSALQAALSDPSGALADTADTVLRKLVDGGILLALSTTIVGGIGGYLMRLLKTLWVGSRLHALFEADHRADMRELLGMAQRIESVLQPASAAAQEPSVGRDEVSPPPYLGKPQDHAPAL